MAESQKVGSSILVGVIVFLAMSAWVAGEVFSTSPYMSSSYVPAYPVPKQAAAADKMVAVDDSLSANEEVVTEPPAAAEPEPAVESPKPRKAVASPVRPASAPRKAEHRRPAIQRTAIVVEERRRTRDERIEMDVMDRIASNPRISGHIGVQAKDAVVRLTGWTRTVGQAREAERDARSVRSVRQVRNEIQPRVGGSV